MISRFFTAPFLVPQPSSLVMLPALGTLADFSVMQAGVPIGTAITSKLLSSIPPAGCPGYS